MRTAMIMMGIICGGSTVFLGASMGILALQGRLEGESLKALSKTPLLGAFLPEPEPQAKDTETPQETGEEDSASPRSKQKNRDRNEEEVPAYINAPEGFSPQELRGIFEDAREAKFQCEKEWAVIEKEKANLERLREDLMERKAELERMLSEVAAAQTELDAAREQFRKEVLTIEESEERMIMKLAEVYENMKEPEKAAKHFDSMDMDLLVKIVVKMDSAKAAKVIPHMEAERVQVLTEKLSRFQERMKSKSGQ